MSAWGYIWMAVLLKVPAVAFAWLVWRALRSDRDTQRPQTSDDGGSKLRPHPRPRVPRPPRRGPHGAAPIPPPRRVRRVTARARVRDV